MDFSFKNTVFAQDQVSEYRAPDHRRLMTWDLLIPELQQGAGLTGGKGSLTPPRYPLGQHQCSDCGKDSPLADGQSG